MIQNKFTCYTNDSIDSATLVGFCKRNLESEKSSLIILSEFIDFNMQDIPDIESIPALKFEYLDSSGNIEYIKICKNFEESINYLKSQYLI